MAVGWRFIHFLSYYYAKAYLPLKLSARSQQITVCLHDSRTVQSLIAVAACDSDGKYTFLPIPFKSNESPYKITNMFTTMAKTIETILTTTTTTTSGRGRFSGNWNIALIVMLGVLGLACVVALLNTWLKRKVKHKYVSSISGAEG